MKFELYWSFQHPAIKSVAILYSCELIKIELDRDNPDIRGQQY